MLLGSRTAVWGLVLPLFGLVGCGSGLLQPRLSPQRGPDRAQAEHYNTLGLQHLGEKQWSQAEAAFRSALEADPYYGAAHSNLGVALLQQGKPYDAVWELRYACRLLPKASEPRVNLGLLFERAGRYPEAERELRDALALAPEDLKVIGQLARVQVRQGKQTEETLVWLQTVATQDDNPQWRTWARRELARASKRDSEVVK
jgi:Flp pilus assembly protein TadD